VAPGRKVGPVTEGRMPTDVQITFHNLAPSAAAEAEIRERIAKLEERHGRITSCRVAVEAARRRTRSTAFQVHIDVNLPGRELVVSHDHADRHPADDLYVAIRQAFDAMGRQITRTAHRRRGEVKRHEAPPRE
jgi:ribosomal subunit interface protein